MTTFVALLRAVNVGGRQLRMADLTSVAEKLGLSSPRTLIASGNLLFVGKKDEATVKRELETALGEHMGKPVEVMVRTAQEMEEVVVANPFAREPGNRVVAIFYDDPPPGDATVTARNVADERLALGRREIYVHYPGGMGRSKLKLSGRAQGTARNMNTVARLAQLAREMA